MAFFTPSSSFHCMDIFVILLFCYNITDKCESKVSWCHNVANCAGYDWCFARRCKDDAIFNYGCYYNNEVPEAARQQSRDWCYAIVESNNLCGELPEDESQILCYSCNTDDCDAATCTKDFCAVNPSIGSGIMDTTETLRTEDGSSFVDDTSTIATTTDDSNPGVSSTTFIMSTIMTEETDASSVPTSSAPTSTITLEKSSNPDKARWTFPPKESLPLFHFEFIQESYEDRIIKEKAVKDE